MSNETDIYERVKRSREATGLSQMAFAKALGYSRNYISQIELGKKHPGARFWRDLNNFEQSYQAFPVERRASVQGARAKLRAARERAGLSYAELSRLTGRPATILEQLENGSIRISEDHIHELCAHLPGLSLEDLKGGSDQPEILSETGLEATHGARPSLRLPPGMTGRYVPLLSYAEAGVLGSEHSDALYDYTSIFALNVDDRRAFAIKVSGNSMEPALYEGDVVICSPAKQLNGGEAAVIRTRSDQVFIKFWRERGDKVILESANPAYEPMPFPAGEIAGAWPIVQRINAGRIVKPAL